MRRRPIVFSERLAEFWTRFVYILIFFTALALLAAVLRARFYSSSPSSVLPGLVLIALGAAIGLIGRFLLLAHREQLRTSSALDLAEQRYKSVFDNALDGILILDDDGVCLEANPAALALLGSDSNQPAGRSIEGFFPSNPDFQTAWRRFLNRSCEHAETRVPGADGRTRYLEYTARANFLPGRHVAVVRDVTRKKEAELALRESEQRFQQMANNIQEVFWMLDAEEGKVLYLSPAYETVTGRSCRSLREDPQSYEEVIHPEDRVRVVSRLNETVRQGHFDEEFRILRPDQGTRWVWVRGFPVKDSRGIVRRVVGTAQDVTSRKAAEEQVARNFDLAEAARAEAEALRRSGLALTQNLSMDYVLDTLLQALLELVPCESAQVILVEAGTRLFLAREVANYKSNLRARCLPETFDARRSPLLMQVLATRNGLLVPDTTREGDWASFNGFSHFCSWLCVPLLASQDVLGVLSLGDTSPRAFNQEHLRLAKSLAIPAAVAIQNARLYEQAEIFRSELEQRLGDLERAEKALGHAPPSAGLS